MVFVCSDSKLKGRPSQIAYEDLRLAPEYSLLQELDRIELGVASFPEEDVLSIPEPSEQIIPQHPDPELPDSTPHVQSSG